MNLITVDRNDIELITKIESMGTWEEEKHITDEHNSFDIWTWNGNMYKIYKDSVLTDREIEFEAVMNRYDEGCKKWQELFNKKK